MFIRSLVMDTLEDFKSTPNEMGQILEFLDTSEIMEFEMESPELTEIILFALADKFKLYRIFLTLEKYK